MFKLLLFFPLYLCAENISYSINPETILTGNNISLFLYQENYSISLETPLKDLPLEFDGLFLLECNEKNAEINQKKVSGVEFIFKSFKDGKVLIPKFKFLATKNSDNSRSTKSLSFPGLEIEVLSSLKNNKWAPFLGPIKKTNFTYPLFLFFVLIIMSYFLSKIRLNFKKPRQVTSINDLKKRILALKESPNVRETFFELSDILKLCIERKFCIKASTMPPSKIKSTLIEKHLDKGLIIKIDDIFSKMTRPKFSNDNPEKNILNSTIKDVLEIIHDF